MKRLALIAFMILAGWGLWHWWSGRAGTAAKKPPVLVSVAQAMREDMTLQLHTVANVVANETVSVRSRLDSQVMEVLFHDGDSVNQGDLLTSQLLTLYITPVVYLYLERLQTRLARA